MSTHKRYTYNHVYIVTCMQDKGFQLSDRFEALQAFLVAARHRDVC